MATLSRRRLLQLCGTAAAAAVLPGCGRTVTQPDTVRPTRPYHETVISLLMPGSSGEKACARISQRLSALTRERLGVALQLEQLPEEKYVARLWERMTRREMPDIFLFSTAQANASRVYGNMLYPLSNLMEEREALWQQFSASQWACQSQFRRIYAVPANTTDRYRQCFLARRDILDALDTDEASIADMDDLYPLLRQVRRKFPEVTPVVPHCGQVIDCTGHDPLGNDLGVILNNRGTTVSNLYAGPRYAELCNRMYRWYMDDLIVKNACFFTETAVDMMRAFNGFGFFSRVEGDKAARISHVVGQELVPLMAGPLLQNSSGASDGWALSVTGTEHEMALAVLELLYTDPEAAALFVYGENGVDDDPAAPPEKKWTNLYADVPCLHPQQEDEERAIVSPAYGFVFNSTACTALDACSTTARRYDGALMSGYVNPEEALPMFLRELEQANLQSIIDLKQQQLNNWLAAIHG